MGGLKFSIEETERREKEEGNTQSNSKKITIRLQYKMPCRGHYQKNLEITLCILAVQLHFNKLNEICIVAPPCSLSFSQFLQKGLLI